MFQKMKNIDTAFRQMRQFCLLFLLVCFGITLFTIYHSHKVVSLSQQKVFVISNGKVLEAYAADRKDNALVEAKDHVSMFHHYFFTLDPDEKVIQTNITKALYMADGSARQEYNTLKENGYFSSLIAGNISQEISVDSVTIDVNQYPYYFKCKSSQKIVRSSTITLRSLVTEGLLRSISRSDNNPHGFLIEKWRILENKDVKTQNR
jgi:conjugative transposon TraK protein